MQIFSFSVTWGSVPSGQAKAFSAQAFPSDQAETCLSYHAGRAPLAPFFWDGQTAL